MKIGIMTFWLSEDNYGQILQCYALQKYLRDAGHDAYLIRYDHRNDYIKISFWRKIVKVFNPIKLYKYLLNKKMKMVDIYEKKNNPRNFNNFRSKYIIQSEKIYYSYKELVESPPEADVYIVGSDQVWNTFGRQLGNTINVIRAYLLDFGDKSIKRIAYAVSFGKEELDSNSIAVFTPLLKKFNYISVREKSGVDICKKCGIDNAEWVPDPTLLLDISTYQSLYKDETISKVKIPYCLLYFVGVKFNLSIQSIYNWAKEKGLEIIYISANLQQDKYKKYYATIPEWLYLLEHAEYVLTNSYHASIFSILFKRKFAVAPIEGFLKGTNSRFISLFEQFKIEKHFIIDNNISNIEKDINWDFAINKNIQIEKQKINEYLQSYLIL
jgi:hypothetical protein